MVLLQNYPNPKPSQLHSRLPSVEELNRAITQIALFTISMIFFKMKRIYTSGLLKGAKMTNRKQKEIHRLIEVKSRNVIDPAGRVVQILKDNHTLKIANTCHRAVHEVYTEALGLGIIPYRYISDRESISIQEQCKPAESRGPK